MTSTFRTLASTCLIGGLVIGTTSVAFATADADPVVLIHEEGDGSLWYNWYETPANRTFLTTSHPCWVDHDHVRLGAQDRQMCSATRP